VSENKSQTCSVIPHKGEVMFVFFPPTTHMNLPPQAARDFAEHILKAAEAAEEQMDAESKP
jgi:hypothetical protein